MTFSGFGAHKREKFQPDEDASLKSLVEQYGTNAWGTIARFLPGRNPRQCRERWKHYLSAEGHNVPWTPEEDNQLYTLMADLGPRWTLISQSLPGRTDMQVKSRWMQQFAEHSDLHLRGRKLLIAPPAKSATSTFPMMFNYVLPKNTNEVTTHRPQPSEIRAADVPRPSTPVPVSDSRDIFDLWND